MITRNIIGSISKYWWFKTRTKSFITSYRIIEVEKEFDGFSNSCSFIERTAYKPDEIHDIFDSICNCKEIFATGHDTRKFNSGIFGWWRMDFHSVDVFRGTFEHHYGYKFNTLLIKCSSNKYCRSNDIYFSRLIGSKV